ncbi:hypothetical protein MKW94_004225 [Papaver nudicaule]|uniref:Uncharacterized protein n=1 Tax=Papaver nudicaule TaxID=74823 RepID=A0AA42AY73_PAPNU|nr:hypothetical protein [Papaver nudicaule]
MPTFSAVTLDRFLEPKSKLKSNKTPAETTSESPFSLPPSPYVVNHKRRGINLQSQGEEALVVDVSVSMEVDENGGEKTNDEKNGERNSRLNDGIGEKNDVSVENGNESDKEIDDFFDPQESMSYTSNTDAEDNERSFKMSTTTTAEFYDASEELSSAGSIQSSMRDLDAEIREIRVNLLTEIERRKRAEDAFNTMEKQWESLREKLFSVGVILPAASAIVGGEDGCDVAEDVCHQVSVARFVADAVGKGVVKAQVEEEMESLVEAKNFEIARLTDRLHYYETMNGEMSNRNQEAMEMARQNRQTRKRRQRWIWSSIGVTVALGSAALAWSYYQPTSKVVLPSTSSQSTEVLQATKL